MPRPTASHDAELSHVLARQLVRRVGHLLTEDGQLELYAEVASAAEALLLTRDTLAASR